MRVQRFDTNPIIRPHMDERMGDNINGPSLICVPSWVASPLGRYYLYFAHHRGTYIRMAYADQLKGPWTIYTPGVLDLAETSFERHIASPDVHVMEKRCEIWMYFHGAGVAGMAGQHTRLATSKDGLHFTVRPELLDGPYWRVFHWDGYFYVFAGGGRTHRSRDGLTDFEEGPRFFTQDLRHAAVKLDGDILTVFFSNAHDCPEHILTATIQLYPDWACWEASEPISLLKPDLDYEGAKEPLVASVRGWAPRPVHQLRDPAVYREEGRTYLLYSVAGEHGIAIAELLPD